MKALIFGSIGTVVETSEMQRRAFNQAFRNEGLDWEWSVDLYQQLLEMSGGRNRIRSYGEQQDQPPSEEQVARIHDDKTEIYHEIMRNELREMRPGVARLIDEARAEGIKLGWASGTSRSNIESIAEVLGGALSLDLFDVVMDRSEADDSKPDPELYEVCLQELGVAADEAIAIEDTCISVQSPVRAGVPCLATPGEYTRNQDFSAAAAVVSQLGTSAEPAEEIRVPHPLPKRYVTLNWLAGRPE